MPSLSTKVKKAVFKKASNYSIPLSSWVDIESMDTFFLIQRMNANFQEPNKNTMIEEFIYELKNLKNILNKIKELELWTKEEMDKIKNEAKRKLNMVDDEISDILKKLDVNVTTLKLRCKFCEKLYYQQKVKIKEKINEIERLKGEVKNNKDELLDRLLGGETKFLNY